MSADGLAFAKSARALVGTRFRLRGRDKRTGLDCVGLVTTALLAIGRTPPDIPYYSLRNRDCLRFHLLFEAAGFHQTAGVILRGDLIILKPSPGQLHLAVADNTARLIHAHAGLGRVVISPFPSPLSDYGHWRLT
ncbi:MAG: NlpC/P60 family protein [Alteraurantiacibacter sp. bin_em_oilr2.035]|uniref:NlpC/P60 family protein n=1 Tax=Aurantiacibacter atlanticus TaxID=1648404 RepID=UPI00065F58FD|nr:NlpC/P60 family protein [Aurantiacibacter atlanticus]MDF1835208.1 NlpC/P60 family protein [Alteraurantiacibacter sp. bin_em_oilr2.035]